MKKKNKQEEKEYWDAVNEANDYLSDAIAHIRELLDESVKYEWNYDLEFDDNDLVNVFFVFIDIMSHKAIKSGKINEKNAIPIIRQFTKDTELAFGVNVNDLIEVIKKRENFN